MNINSLPTFLCRLTLQCHNASTVCLFSCITMPCWNFTHSTSKFPKIYTNERLVKLQTTVCNNVNQKSRNSFRGKFQLVGILRCDWLNKNAAYHICIATLKIISSIYSVKDTKNFHSLFSESCENTRKSLRLELCSFSYTNSCFTITQLRQKRCLFMNKPDDLECLPDSSIS